MYVNCQAKNNDNNTVNWRKILLESLLFELFKRYFMVIVVLFHLLLCYAISLIFFKYSRWLYCWCIYLLFYFSYGMIFLFVKENITNHCPAIRERRGEKKSFLVDKFCYFSYLTFSYYVGGGRGIFGPIVLALMHCNKFGLSLEQVAKNSTDQITQEIPWDLQFCRKVSTN